MNLSCPVCNRDFEIPRRSLLRPDDIEFTPCPRVLPCLHTVCHSCLEEQRQRSKYGKVICPICRSDRAVKGVKYLPHDYLALKEVLLLSSLSLGSCIRCYDDVPSYSWCADCSEALCEFHHQDHKLSLVTSHHDISTFKEISATGTSVIPKLPLPQCPEIPSVDCTAYCHTCCHLVSANGTLLKHKDHNVEDCTVAFPVSKERIQDAKLQTQQKEDDILNSIEKIRETLSELDKGFDDAANKVEKVFSDLRKQITARENSLLTRLEEITLKRRNALQKQLSSLVELRDDCKHLVSTSDDILKVEVNSVENINYIVGLTDAIEDRSDAILEIAESTPSQPVTTTYIAANFFTTDLEIIENIISTTGSIETEQYVVDAKKSNNMSQSKKDTEQTINIPEIYFTVSSDVSDDNSTLYEKRNKIIIEARSSEKLYVESSEKKSDKDDKGHDQNNINRQGRVLGKISLSIEFDKNLLGRHELRSFFETAIDDNGIPYMTVSKDFVSS